MRLSNVSIILVILCGALSAQQTVTTPGGSANSVPKFAGPNSITNSALAEVGGKVGIGNSSPPAPLSFSTGTGDKIQLYTGVGTGRYGFGIQPNTMVQYINGASPGLNKFSWRIAPSSGDPSTGSEFANLLTTGSFNLFLNNSTANGLSITGATGQAGNYLNLSSKGGSTGNVFVVRPSGNVGIGTNSPGSPLTVAGIIQSTSGGVKFPDNTVQTTAGIQTSGQPTDGNTAVGIGALQTSSSGIARETAIGYMALAKDQGNNNTATGYLALSSNTSGTQNTADGASALALNTTGVGNTGVGLNALQSNTTGQFNTGVGNVALEGNTTGIGNVGIGAATLSQNTSGQYNVALGTGALGNGTFLNGNTAIGSFALESSNGGGSVAIGANALRYSSGSATENIAIGDQAGTNVTTGQYNILIGHLGTSTDSQLIRIGNPGYQTKTFIAGINGTTVSAGALNLFVDSNGQLGTLSSSERYKQDIQDIGKTSSGLMSLRPVRFHYKEHPEANFEYGLIAEEVAKAYPDLVTYSTEGQPESVQYHKVNAMLLNEMQRQQAEIGDLKHQNQLLEDRLAKLEAVLVRK